MTYVISDIHGDYDRYKKMLDEIEFKPSDTLYVLGDVIDRGPGGVKILLDMMGRANVIPLLGNHEYTAYVCLPLLLQEITEESIASLDERQTAALSEWMKIGGDYTVRELREISREDREEILGYIWDMDLYAEVKIRDRSFVLVHSGLGGFHRDKPLENYDILDLLFSRPEPDGKYYPDKTLIFGHTPTRVLTDGQDRIVSWGTAIDIDCGCGFGGVLGCLCLDTMEEFYV